MTFLRACCISFCLLLSGLFAKAQQKYPPTFLWRIAGNGLENPSYLYGTIHLRDKVVFNLGDSIYAAIAKTDGLATELNPNLLADSIFSRMDNNYVSPSDDEDRLPVDDKKYRMPRKLAKKMKKYEKEWKKNMEKKDEMPSILDMYLYKIASGMGKVTGGIEDVSDQFNTADEIGRLKFDTAEIKDAPKFTQTPEQMRRTYAARDLTGVDSMVSNEYSKAYMNILLTKRNIKMAMRMDSIARLRSNFFAVGVAHLPGDSGLIKLLQNKGYEVTPVFSSNYIPADSFKYVSKEQPWVSISDDNNICSVEMPGQPFQMTAKSKMPLKMYMDLTELSYYGFDVEVVTSDEQSIDSLRARMKENYKKSGIEVIDQKEITYKGAKGLEVIAKDFRGNNFKMRVLNKDNIRATMTFGSQTKENINSAHADKFLNSLVFNTTEMPTLSGWKTYPDTAKAFSVIMPSVPRKSIDRGSNTEQYGASDISNGSFYLVNTVEVGAGSYLTADSAYFENLREYIEKGGKLTEFVSDTLNGFPAHRYKLLKEQSGLSFVMTGYIIPRGNRVYMPLVAATAKTADDPAIKAFFNSFKLLPYSKTAWSEKSISPDNELSVWVPGDIDDITPDSLSSEYNKMEKLYRSTDKNTVNSYNMDITTNSPYFWVNDDSAFFKKRSESFKGYKDSIISYSYTKSPLPVSEILIKINGIPVYKKMKMVLNGDKEYVFYAYLPEETLNSKDAKLFFSQQKFTSEKPSNIFADKMPLLLAGLKSKDSATRSDAVAALHAMDFVKGDLPELYKAMLYKYDVDTDSYQTTNDIIADKIAAVNDSSVVDFVNANYSKYSKDSSAMAVQLLKLLVKNRTAKAMATFKDLALKAPPAYGHAYGLGYLLSDSLELTKVLFPEGAALYGDTILGPPIMFIANTLMDSSMIDSRQVLQNEKAVLAIAEQQFAAVKKGNDDFPAYNDDLAALLGRFNTKESNGMLYKFLELPDLDIKTNATLALLKNNSTVPASQLKKLAADNGRRTDFYESLKRIKKEQLFPEEFLTQKKFAESYMYSYMLEEEEIKDIKLIGQKEVMIKDTLRRFYIFKVKTVGDDGNDWHLGICGIFSTNDKEPDMVANGYFIRFNGYEVYDEKLTDEKFKEYAAELNKE